MVRSGNGNQGHSDLQAFCIAKDEEDIKNNWMNPFTSNQQLTSISTGALAPPDIATDLEKAYQVGEEAYQAFKRVS